MDAEKELAIRLAREDEKLAKSRWNAALGELEQARATAEAAQRAWQEAQDKLTRLLSD